MKENGVIEIISLRQNKMILSSHLSCVLMFIQ